MGIRNRTPIGTLRDQRRKAENVPQVEAVKAKTPMRARAFYPSNGTPLVILPETSENLLERLRIVLRSENSRSLDSMTEFQVLQDELSRISQHHQLSRADNARELVDLEVPRKHIETAAPFRYIVINGGKTSDDFPSIPKLDRALSTFELYTQELPKNPTPTLMPLTLLISPEESEVKLPVNHDPARDAAQLTQSSVTYPQPANKGSVLPKSLVLSLLDDK